MNRAPRVSPETPQTNSGRFGSRRRAMSATTLDLDLNERARVAGGHAVPALAVRTLSLDPGVVVPGSLTDDEPANWLGLLILDGLITVQLDVGSGHAGWLVGADDLLRPWDMEELSLTSVTTWRVLTRARVALLDERFAVHAGRSPAVTRALVSRAARTAHWLLAKSVIISCPHIDDRLVLMLALLGERWGKVTPDGVQLDLPLTHSVLAYMCGARRPSVTLALQALQAQGVIERRARQGWLLRRLESVTDGVHPSSWSRYADALGLSTVKASA